VFERKKCNFVKLSVVNRKLFSVSVLLLAAFVNNFLIMENTVDLRERELQAKCCSFNSLRVNTSQVHIA
jgi:hypothetical protein